MKDGSVWGWTDERRAKQAAAIRRWQPWTRSTGPRTPQGKAIVARNACKPNSIRQQLLAMKRELRAPCGQRSKPMRATAHLEISQVTINAGRQY
jgi:hypothetical protein